MFKQVEYAYTTIPTYPCGQIGFIMCSNGPDIRSPSRRISEAMTEKDADSLEYYNEDLHAAAFVLPTFVRRACQNPEKRF